MDFSELQGKTIVQLRKMLTDASRELLDYRMQHAGGGLTKTHMLTVKRREIAKIRTKISALKHDEQQQEQQKEQQEVAQVESA